MSTIAETPLITISFNAGRRIVAWLAQWAFAVVACLPALYVAALITQAGSLPDNDYWSYLDTILREDGFSPWPGDWLAHGTEHIVLLPKIIYALNAKLTGGDNRFLGFIALGFACLEAAILLIFTKKYFSAPEKHLAILAIVIFIFTPNAAHNWMLGMSGVAWIGANALALSAFYFFIRQRIHLSCLLGLTGLLTYSTALGIWPALIAGALWQRQPPAITIKIIAHASLAALIFLFFYHKPAAHPDLQADPLLIWDYFRTLTGGIFTRDALLAQQISDAGLVSLVFILWRLVKTPALRAASAPWLMVSVYALANMAMIAPARAGFGVEQAFASRYMALPALFWLGWFCLALLMTRTAPLPHHWRYPPFLSLLVILSLASFSASESNVGYLIKRSQNKPLAMVSIYTEGYDFELLSKTVTPILRTEKGRYMAATLIPRLKKIQHIPFDGTFSHCPKPGEKLNTPASTQADRAGLTGGFFDNAWEMDPLNYKLDGWAIPLPGNKIVCIAITNQDYVVRGLAITGFPRPDVNDYLGMAGDFGWQGYAKVDPDDERLFAFVLTGNPLQWHELNKSHLLPFSNEPTTP